MNSFLTNIGDKLVSKIPLLEVALEIYLKSTLTNEEFTKKELKDASRCLQFNRSMRKLLLIL